MNSEEDMNIIKELDNIVRDSLVKELVNSFTKKAEEKLRQNPESDIQWLSIPFGLFEGRLPDCIKSGWVFVIRKGVATDPERHPESRQRMMSYKGSGDMQTWDGKRWLSRNMVSNEEEPLGKRWISIPQNEFHYAVTKEVNWVVVSFHTVNANELVEERASIDDLSKVQKQKYIGK